MNGVKSILNQSSASAVRKPMCARGASDLCVVCMSAECNSPHWPSLCILTNGQLCKVQTTHEKNAENNIDAADHDLMIIIPIYYW